MKTVILDDMPVVICLLSKNVCFFGSVLTTFAVKWHGTKPNDEKIIETKKSKQSELYYSQNYTL